VRCVLLAALLVAGCAPVERVKAPANHTTIYRYTSHACESPLKPNSNTNTKADDVELRKMTKSRDDWKRYAESLELLTPKDADRAPHP
jgi:hypothetical protein